MRVAARKISRGEVESAPGRRSRPGCRASGRPSPRPAERRRRAPSRAARRRSAPVHAFAIRNRVCGVPSSRRCFNTRRRTARTSRAPHPGLQSRQRVARRAFSARAPAANRSVLMRRGAPSRLRRQRTICHRRHRRPSAARGLFETAEAPRPLRVKLGQRQDGALGLARQRAQQLDVQPLNWSKPSIARIWHIIVRTVQRPRNVAPCAPSPRRAQRPAALFKNAWYAS